MSAPMRVRYPVLLFAAALAQTPLPTQRIRGDVVALDGLSLQVRSRTGEALTIKLAENYMVTSVVKVDGEQTLLVPPDAPIVTFEPGERSMVVPGAHVILTATRQADGSLTAGRVAVGKNGLVPPM